MDKEICGVTGATGTVAYVLTRSDEQFRIEVKEGFTTALTNPLRTVGGTVGSHNRAYLHEKLDEWVDNTTRVRREG